MAPVEMSVSEPGVEGWAMLPPPEADWDPNTPVAEILWPFPSGWMTMAEYFRRGRFLPPVGGLTKAGAEISDAGEPR
jgi:hypothetical protein